MSEENVPKTSVDQDPGPQDEPQEQIPIPKESESGAVNIVKRQSKSGNVKFTEPLNDYNELESKYAEIMGHTSDIQSGMFTENPVNPMIDSVNSKNTVIKTQPVAQLIETGNEIKSALEASIAPATSIASATSILPETFTVSETSIAPELTTPSTPRNTIMNLIPNETPTTVTDQSSSVKRFVNDAHEINFPDQVDRENDPFGDFEITPEEIFNEIKVAHAEKTENEGAQNLHSFIISKSFSSENVVVLLNLRRLKDGEWALDKTVAQGLKSETYGGLVSIDQYGFSENGSEHLPSNSRLVDGEPEIDRNPSDDERHMMEILMKLENYVNSVNKEIEAARNIMNNAPLCREGPCSSKRVTGLPTFDELPITDQLIKMFKTLTCEDDICNHCDEIDASSKFTTTNAEMIKWIRSLLGEIASFLGVKLPFMAQSSSSLSAADLLSQSRALLDQARQSGLLKQKNSKPFSGSNRSSFDSVKSDLSLANQSDIATEEEAFNVIRKTEEDLDIAASMEINIETKSNLEEFIRENISSKIMPTSDNQSQIRQTVVPTKTSNKGAGVSPPSPVSTQSGLSTGGKSGYEADDELSSRSVTSENLQQGTETSGQEHEVKHIKKAPKRPEQKHKRNDHSKP